MSDTNLLSREDLHARGISFSKSQLWRLVKAGKFPQPVRVGLKRIAWFEAEIDDWLRERASDRSAA